MERRKVFVLAMSAYALLTLLLTLALLQDISLALLLFFPLSAIAIPLLVISSNILHKPVSKTVFILTLIIYSVAILLSIMPENSLRLFRLVPWPAAIILTTIMAKKIAGWDIESTNKVLLIILAAILTVFVPHSLFSLLIGFDFGFGLMFGSIPALLSGLIIGIGTIMQRVYPGSKKASIIGILGIIVFMGVFVSVILLILFTPPTLPYYVD